MMRKTGKTVLSSDCPRCGTPHSIDIGRDQQCKLCGLGYEVGRDGLAWDWYNDDPWKDNSSKDVLEV